MKERCKHHPDKTRLKEVRRHGDKDHGKNKRIGKAY